MRKDRAKEVAIEAAQKAARMLAVGAVVFMLLVTGFAAWKVVF